MSTLRHAPADWIPGQTRVRYLGHGPALSGAVGTFVGDSYPMSGTRPRGWLGVFVQFDGLSAHLDVDVADLEVVTA